MWSPTLDCSPLPSLKSFGTRPWKWCARMCACTFPLTWTVGEHMHTHSIGTSGVRACCLHKCSCMHVEPSPSFPCQTTKPTRLGNSALDVYISSNFVVSVLGLLWCFSKKQITEIFIWILLFWEDFFLLFLLTFGCCLTYNNIDRLNIYPSCD